MARTKTTDTAESTTLVAAAVTSTGKMNLTTFLRKNPQNSYVTAILKSKYKTKFYTEEGWFAIIDEILNRKVS